VKGRILARGVMWRKGDWLFNVYARPGDKFPTVAIRRVRGGGRRG